MLVQRKGVFDPVQIHFKRSQRLRQFVVQFARNAAFFLFPDGTPY